MFQSTEQLDEHQLKDLEQLRVRCRKTDGSTPNLYTHILAQPRALPASLLCYEQGRLLGFLGAFFFYNDAVEIALLVDPELRKKGIATELMRLIIPLIQSVNFTNLIFSSPSKLNDDWLPNKKFTYMHSEYYMERKELNPLLENNHALVYRAATNSDLSILYALDEACFQKKSNNDVPDRFQHLVGNRSYHIVIAYQNNQPIGKAHLRWDAHGATLSDIAIMPSLQGQGLGTALITHCINFALSEGKPTINLDVETHNQRALNLYTRLGFAIQNSCDYWSISIKQLGLVV
ncbi:MAG: GNAT family N-acetyltransferase [Legionellales bacterium]